jgi:hypothetical protein
VIAALQAAAGVQVKPSGTAVTEARQQGSDRESVASGAARSSFADGRDMLGGEHTGGVVVLGVFLQATATQRVAVVLLCREYTYARCLLLDQICRWWSSVGGFL